MKQPICVHLRSSAVRDFDTHSLPRMPIGAPDSLKYLALSSYEFVLSSLFIFHLALRSLRSSAVNESDSEINLPHVMLPAPPSSPLMRGASRQTARRDFVAAPDL